MFIKMSRPTTLAATTLAAIAGLMVLGAVSANAAERPFTVQDKVTRAECGDCHMVFPPSRLTRTAWKKIMGSLSDHFGEDASLDADTSQHIEGVYVAGALDRPDKNGKMGIRTKMRLAAWKKKGVVDPLRITETPEWIRHHVVKANYKKMSADKKYSRGSNCITCHANGERGIYEDFGEM
ncbi:MAG: hypothetical protein JKY92_03610 [Magnetovibrio sp.]|nr:hypothetical protein [Magnetovibrio sp.]